MKMLQRSGSSNSVLSTECPTLPELQDDDASTADDMSRSDEESPSSAGIEADSDAADIVATESLESRKLTQLDFEHLRSFAARSMTSIESEDGDSRASFTAEECINNPSLLLAAAKMECFRHDLKQAATEAKELEIGCDAEAVGEICDRFAVKVGVRLLELPGLDRVAMEVDPAVCFDTEASVAKASKMLNMYSSAGIPKERIVVKLAPSWESIQACKLLEARSISCDMTLLQHQNSEKDGKQLRAFIRKVLKL